MILTEAQVGRIRKHVEESGVTLPTLRDDIVDHLSCVVESEVSDGKDFEVAFREAVKDLAPDGLAEIQKETVRLFNLNNLVVMKPFMYFIGLITSIAIAMGWLFSVLHWPGAHELFNYGFLGFLLLFVPLIAFDRFKRSVRKAVAERLKIALGCLSGVIVGVSLVFKLLHLQGADTLLVVGMVLFAFGFLPFLFFTNYRKAISPSDPRKG